MLSLLRQFRNLALVRLLTYRVIDANGDFLVDESGNRIRWR